MNFTVSNLGPINTAPISFKDLTVLCGGNNTGKTYFIYAFYSLLNAIRSARVYKLSEKERLSFCSGGKVQIEILNIVSAYREMFTNAFRKEFLGVLAKDLAMEGAVPANAEVDLSLGREITEVAEEFCNKDDSTLTVSFSRQTTIRCSHTKGQDSILCEYLPPKPIADETPPVIFPLDESVLKILDWMLPLFIQNHIVRPFFITCERNGIAMFGRELNLFNALATNGTVEDLELLQKIRKRFEFRGYSLPVRREIDFNLKIHEIQKRKSFLAEIGSSVIAAFDKIAGGTYCVSDDAAHVLRFTPKGVQTGPIPITECSSSVRSLVELNYYIKHLARRGDLLMIDEPELDLHPELQRKVARLIASMVNEGIKVFVSTHSDYFVREMNVLLAGHDRNGNVLIENAKRLGCSKNELVDPSRVSCYIMQDGGVSPMKFVEGIGFPVKSFDDNIRNFNEFKHVALDIYSEKTQRVTEDSGVE